MRIGDNPVCKSPTASYIALTLCYGKAWCAIPVSGKQNFTWTDKLKPDLCGPSGTVISKSPATNEILCSASFSSGSSFTGCGTKPRRLAVVAKCYRSEVCGSSISCCSHVSTVITSVARW